MIPYFGKDTLNRWYNKENYKILVIPQYLKDC